MLAVALSTQGWISLAVLVAAVVLFLNKRVPIPIVALSIPIVLYAAGILDAKQAMAGFGNFAALTIAAVFVIGAGLKEAGVATLIARGLQKLGGRSEPGLIILIMLAASTLSAFMSNAAVVAILLPVGLALSRRSGVAPSRLLLPMAFAAVLGGTITVLGTAPHILLDDFLRLRTGQGFSVFEFSPVGIPLVVTGILFMAFVGRRMLPVVSTEDRLRAARLPEDAARNFRFEQKLFKLRVVDASGCRGMTLAEADLRNRYHVSVVVVKRPGPMGARWLEPRADLEMRPEDLLLVEGSETAVWAFSEEELLQMGLADADDVTRILGRGTTLAEVTASPHSRILGKSFKTLDFGRRFELNVLTIWRHGATLPGNVGEIELELGDTFLVSGPAERVRSLSTHPDYVVLTDVSQDEDRSRAPLAIFFLCCALVPPILYGVPLAVSAIGAGLLMAATGCISGQALRRAVDWKVIFLIVGTIPLGEALDRTHVAQQASLWIVRAHESLGAPGALGALFLLGAILAVLTSNAAAAVIAAPVALEACGPMGMDVHRVLMAVGYGCSCAFLLPFAQCNILVMSPGGYRTLDFVRVGAWSSLIMAATAVGLLCLL